jgi:voltage-dependent calcium channel alpha-2/delta-3
VIDSNGYVVISEANPNNTGRFFGELEGAVMEVMVEADIFSRITVYDYQGLCKNVSRGNETSDDGSRAHGLITVRTSLQIYRSTFAFIVI